jgi:hypothetical protein
MHERLRVCRSSASPWTSSTNHGRPRSSTKLPGSIAAPTVAASFVTLLGIIGIAAFAEGANEALIFFDGEYDHNGATVLFDRHGLSTSHVDKPTKVVLRIFCGQRLHDPPKNSLWPIYGQYGHSLNVSFEGWGSASGTKSGKVLLADGARLAASTIPIPSQMRTDSEHLAGSSLIGDARPMPGTLRSIRRPPTDCIGCAQIGR